jgi:hypothetical protein
MFGKVDVIENVMAQQGTELQYGFSTMVTSLKIAGSSALVGLSFVFLTLTSDQAWSQPYGQRMVALQRVQRTTPPVKPAASAPAVDSGSALGQALASCNKDSAAQETFVLPGLKGEVTLDRCYKGRAHLNCVIDALVDEAKHLTDAYTRIVDAKYPDISSVENVCQLKRDAVASDIAGSEDFIKRFAALKSQYESASKCVASMRQGFQNVVLTDLAQPPEILKSMNDTIDADFNRASQVEEKIVDLADKIDASKKALQTLDKIHRTMCIIEKNTNAQVNEGASDKLN